MKEYALLSTGYWIGRAAWGPLDTRFQVGLVIFGLCTSVGSFLLLRVMEVAE